jgi:hypothetical protein
MVVVAASGFSNERLVVVATEARARDDSVRMNVRSEATGTVVGGTDDALICSEPDAEIGMELLGPPGNSTTLELALTGGLLSETGMLDGGGCTSDCDCDWETGGGVVIDSETGIELDGPPPGESDAEIGMEMGILREIGVLDGPPGESDAEIGMEMGILREIGMLRLIPPVSEDDSGGPLLVGAELGGGSVMVMLGLNMAVELKMILSDVGGSRMPERTLERTSPSPGLELGAADDAAGDDGASVMDAEGEALSVGVPNGDETLSVGVPNGDEALSEPDGEDVWDADESGSSVEVAPGRLIDCEAELSASPLSAPDAAALSPVDAGAEESAGPLALSLGVAKGLPRMSSRSLAASARALYRASLAWRMDWERREWERLRAES